MDLPFAIKKFFEVLLYPSGIVFFFLLLAFLASFSRYRRSQTRFLLAVAFVLFYAFSTPWLPRIMLHPLEECYPEPSSSQIAEAQAVVLLPAYIASLPGLELRERPGLETSKRLLAAMLLAREYRLPLIIVGGGWPQGPGASYLAEIASKFGLKRVEAYDAANDTRSSALVLRKRLAGRKFLLVSSAYHLPRAVYLFRRAGLEPIPYPAFRLVVSGKVSFYDFWPDPFNLFRANRAMHEYLGLAFYWLEDHIPFFERGKHGSHAGPQNS